MTGFRTFAGLAALGLCLTALGTSVAFAQELAADQVLRRGNGAEPGGVDPAKTDDVQSTNVEIDLFEGLITLDTNTKVAPGVAKSWTISPDGLTYTFKLRDDAKWSNGDKVTADDFVYSFERAADPKTGSSYGFMYYPIKNGQDVVEGKQPPSALGVRAVDPSTFEITLNSPTGYFLAALAHNVFLPVNKGNVEKFGEAFTHGGNLVSNGAFTLKEWTPQSRMVLVKNPNYWDAGKVKLNEVDYLPIEDQNEDYKRYRAGEEDIVYEVSSDQVDQIRKDLPKEFKTYPWLGVYYLDFNMTLPPLKDSQQLRQALSEVIDREELVKKVVKTGELPAYSYVPPGIPGYESQMLPFKNKSMAERIAEARKVFADAGYTPDHPLKVQIIYNTSANHKKIMIAVAAMWKQALGVQVELVNQEWKVFLDTRKQKQAGQIYRDGWIADYADPNTFLTEMLSTSGENNSGWKNADFDAAVNKGAVATDAAARSKALEEAEAIMMKDQPVAPLYDYVNKQMVKPYVLGYHPNLIGYSYSKNISIAQH